MVLKVPAKKYMDFVSVGQSQASCLPLNLVFMLS